MVPIIGHCICIAALPHCNNRVALSRNLTAYLPYHSVLSLINTLSFCSSGTTSCLCYYMYCDLSTELVSGRRKRLKVKHLPVGQRLTWFVFFPSPNPFLHITTCLVHKDRVIRSADWRHDTGLVWLSDVARPNLDLGLIVRKSQLD